MVPAVPTRLNQNIQSILYIFSFSYSLHATFSHQTDDCMYVNAKRPCLLVSGYPFLL